MIATCPAGMMFKLDVQQSAACAPTRHATITCAHGVLLDQPVLDQGLADDVVIRLLLRELHALRFPEVAGG